MTSGSVLVGWHPPRLVLLWIQINGVDMTEARHDQAVALLTGTSPTIALLVERDLNAPGGSPGQTRARAHSPPPPEPSDSPDQDEESLGNHLSRMEDEYPIEVRIRGLTCVSNSFCWFLFSRFSSHCCRNVIEALSVNACLCGLALSLLLSSSREDGVWYEGLSS